MIYCTNCGHSNDDTARSCVKCGARFTGQSGTTPFTTAPPPANPGTQQQQGSPWGGTPPPHGWQQPPQQQGMQPVYTGPGLYAVGEKREPVMTLVLPLVTCGIYGFYWWYVTATEIRNALNRPDINPGMDLMLGILTCGIYFIFLAHKYTQLMLEMQDRAGLPRNDISLVALLLYIFFNPASFFIMQTELNRIWDAAMSRR
jgi:hypothetical protein